MTAAGELQPLTILDTGHIYNGINFEDENPISRCNTSTVAPHRAQVRLHPLAPDARCSIVANKLMARLPQLYYQ